MANGKNFSIMISSIACYGTSDFAGDNDEVYILYQADAGLPVRYPAVYYQRMNTTADPNSDPKKTVLQTWDVGLQLDFDYEVLVTLWDQDVKGVNSASEFLINVDYASGAASTTNMVNNNGANYTITATAVD
jgi:hypothetical protein